MVSRAEETMKNRHPQWSSSKGKETSSSSTTHQMLHQHYQKNITQCNKGKSSRFKRSSSEDGASAAILFLACIACTPYSA